MSTIRLNGAEHPLLPGQSVAALVGDVTGRRIDEAGQSADGRRLGVAVALNADIVPRSRWTAVMLQAGDDVEIVTAVQGG